MLDDATRKRRAVDTADLDEQAICRAVSDVYALLGQTLTQVAFVDSPRAAYELARQRLGKRRAHRQMRRAEIRERESIQLAEQLDYRNKPFAQAIIELERLSHRFWLLDDIAIFSRKPVEVKTNDLGNIDSDSGPAIVYADGFSLYALCGIVLTNRQVQLYFDASPEQLDQLVNKVLKEPVLARRALIHGLFGWGRVVDYIRCAKRSFDCDERDGLARRRLHTVYTLDVGDNDARLLNLHMRLDSQGLYLLECYNHTCNACLERIAVCACEIPDRKRYVEIVPAEADTVLKAHAWRWGLSFDLTAQMIEDRA
jgi:hypothetical protein